MKIYITGISGTGKSSLARALQQKGINAIDIDGIAHWRNKTNQEIVEWLPGDSDDWHASHDWVCDISKLKELLSKSENSIALGHGSNQEEYLPLFDKTFVLKCRAETIISRIQSRTDNDFGKDPRDLARILKWHKNFDSWMVEKGAKILDGEKPTGELVEEVISELSK